MKSIIRFIAVIVLGFTVLLNTMGCNPDSTIKSTKPPIDELIYGELETATFALC